MKHVVNGHTYNPKFEDGEKALLNDTTVTIKRWNYAPNLKLYTYTIEGYESTFCFEYELRKVGDTK